MEVLAVVGSPRKGQATDLLVDRVIEGLESSDPDCRVKKINLVDCRIGFCRNCLACRDSREDGPLAKCSIRDDMDWIYQDILKSDALILGTPVHSGYATALMATFLERITWPFARPEKTVLGVKGIPLPRSKKPRKAVILVVSGIVPPVFRMLCDCATGHIRGIVKDALNAKTVGDLYAGNIEGRGVEYYYDQALGLGRKLARSPERGRALGGRVGRPRPAGRFHWLL
ncbi:MAG: flavodoxin family protein [Pseudomonadota bacterium]